MASVCRCSTCTLEGSLVQNAFSRDSGRTKMLCFSIQRVAPDLASQALRNDGCGTSSRHSRIMLGPCSKRPSIVTSFHLFLVYVLLIEFHCVLQLLDGFRTVNLTVSVAGG